MIKYILIAILAYLLGNITGSYILSKILYKEDIREKGSGNAGTTNMVRIYGMLPGILTLFIDLIKGYLAVYVSSLIDPYIGPYIAGVFVVVGHVWPVFLKFKGGKGMATSGGIFLFLSPKLLIMAIILMILICLIFKIMSLASLTAAIFIPLASYFMYPENRYMLFMSIILCIIVFYSHRTNIKRLIKGNENKLSIGRKNLWTYQF